MSDRLNTIFGWLLFAGVVALMLRFAVGLIMPEEHRPHDLGYVIEVEDTGEGAVAGPTLAMMLADGDSAAGANTFAKCIACHTIDAGGADGIGPNLAGVMNSAVAGNSGAFTYSSALADVGGSWTYEQMDAWLTSPRAFANGTKMSFAGLGDGQDRADVMLYLLENGGGPALPVVVEPVVEEETGEEGEAEDEAEADAEVELEEAA